MSDLNKSYKNYSFLEIAGKNGYPLYYLHPAGMAMKLSEEGVLVIIAVEEVKDGKQYTYRKAKYSDEELEQLLQGMELVGKHEFMIIARRYIALTKRMDELIGEDNVKI